MKLKNRRMLSLLMAIVMVLTMTPFHPLEVSAAATTLDLGTPDRTSTTNYQLSNAEFGSTGVVDAGGGYFTAAVNNGSIAVGTVPNSVTESTYGIEISGIVTDQSTPANRVFNFSGAATYEDIQAVIRNMTFTQVAGQTQSITVNVVPGAPLSDGKTSVRTYNGRHFAYVQRQATMTFNDAVTIATSNNGHLVEPTAGNPEEMLAIASLFNEFKSPWTGNWNFISFIGATKTTASSWSTSVNNETRYVTNGQPTGLESTSNFVANGAYDHLTLLLNNSNTTLGYLAVNNTHGGASAFKDPGVIVEYNSGVINIITAKKDVATGGIYASAGATASQGSTPVVVDWNLIVNYSGNGGILPGATVVIDNFRSGDSLSVDETVAGSSGITVDKSNAANGVLILKGNVSAAHYQNLLRTVTYSTTSTDVSDRTISFSMGSALSYSGNGHFYEYLPAGALNWDAAVTAASNRAYFGRQGYLATITSQGENDFIAQKTQGVGWIGAVDIGRKNGESATNNPAAGDWRWVTGPEGLQDSGKGLPLWNGYSPGSSVGAYANWASGEPNNYSESEQVAHIFGPGSNSGKWNDYPLNWNGYPFANNVVGYVVEYGGMPSDDTSIQISTTKTIVVPRIVSITAAVYKSETDSVYNGSSTITATPLNVNTVMTVTDANGDPITGLRAFDQSGNEITAGVNGWYPSNGSPIVFLPFMPGGTYKVAAEDTSNADTTTPKAASETQSITLPTAGDNVTAGRDSGHPGKTTITVDPSSTLAKYAIADMQGNVVSDWKTGTGSDITFDNLDPATHYQIVTIPADAGGNPPLSGVSGTRVITPVAPVDANNILRMPTNTAGSDLIHINNTAPAIQYALVDKSTGQYVDVHGNLSTEPVWTSGNGSTLTFQPVDAAKTYQVLARPIPAAGEISPMPTSGTDVLPYQKVNISGGMMYEDATYPTQATITVAGVTGTVNQNTGKYAVNGIPVGVYPANITITNPDNASLNATFTTIATVDDEGNVTFGPFTPNAGTPAGMSVTSDEKGNITVHPSTAVSQVASNMAAAIHTNTVEALQAAHDEFTALTPEEQLQISRTTVENVSNAILNLLQASLKISSAVSGVANPAVTRNQLDSQKGMLLTSAEIAQVLSGQSLNVTLNLNATDVSNSTAQEVSDDKSLIETLIAPSAANIGFMYDINITKKVDVLNSSGAVINAGASQLVPVVPEPISITLNIPTNLLGYQYFAIVRVHNGLEEFIPSSVNGTTVTFSSTKFSTYALVYSNQMIFADNLPGTGPSLPSNNAGSFIGSTVTIDNVSNGKVIVDNSSATSGTKVTITVKPDAGYTLDKLSITDDKGNVINYTDLGNGTYTYIQPNGTVKIKATFKTDTGVSKLLNTMEHFAYLRGYEDGTFRSNASMTRAEVAQMFYNLLKNKNLNTSGIHFADVPDNAWYAKAVNTLANLGIIKGYKDGTYAPDKAITRAEFTIIAVSFSNKAAGNKSFTDVSNTHWAYSSIATSAEYGWVNGYPDGTFKPDKTITRAESATIVNRMLNRQPDKKAIDASAGIKVFKDLSSGYWAYYDIMEATNDHQYETSNGVEIWVP